jgi:hypothetical protein
VSCSGGYKSFDASQHNQRDPSVSEATTVLERELSWVPLGRRSLYGPCLDSHWRDQLLEHAGARERQQAYSCADLCEL